MLPEIRRPAHIISRLTLAEQLLAGGVAQTRVRELTGVSPDDIQRLSGPGPAPAAVPIAGISGYAADKLSVAHTMFYWQSLRAELARRPAADTADIILAAWHAYTARAVLTHHDRYHQISLARAAYIYTAVRERPTLVHTCESCHAEYLRDSKSVDARCPLCQATQVLLCRKCDQPYVQFSLVPAGRTGPQVRCCGKCRVP